MTGADAMTQAKKYAAKKSNKSEKKPLSEKIVHAIKLIQGELQIPDFSYGRARKKLIRMARVAFASAEKFMIDDCLTKASSLAYTTIVSLIPTLAVGLSIFSFTRTNKEQLFAQAQRFLETYVPNRLNIDPFLDAISTLIDNAGSIGGIGAVVLIFSATAVLRTLEHSLNTIWNIKRERSWIQKMIYYWAAITLGPIMLIAGTTAAAQVSTIFSAPNYHAITQSTDGMIWIAGTKGAIRHTSGEGRPFEQISTDQIDFDNQAVYEYDKTSGDFVKTEGMIDESDLKKIEFRDITFSGKTGWAVGRNGYILKTSDGGRKWHIEKWGAFNFKDVAIRDEKNIFIAAEGGFLLQSGTTAEPSVLSWPEITGDINQIAFDGDTGVAVCNRGYILLSDNGGSDWTPILLEKSQIKKQRYVNLNSVHFLGGDRAWIAGNSGLILATTDGFRSFTSHNFKKYNYTSIVMTGTREGYAAGESGVIVHTGDGGKTWKKKSIQTGEIHRLGYIKNMMWAVGDRGLARYGKSISSQWKGEKGSGFVVYSLNFFLPFIFIWLSFLVIYLLLPNTRVPLRPAAIGASISGAIWVGFTIAFIFYIRLFANSTFAVYGALAALPIFLLLIYSSAVIILYGAEVSYMTIYLDSYLKQKRLKRAGRALSVFTAIKVIHAIYRKYEMGKGATEISEIVKLTERNYEADYLANLYRDAGFIIEDGSGCLLPAMPSNTLLLSKVIDLVHDKTLEIPESAPNDDVRKTLTPVFAKISSSRKSILGDMKLSDLMK
jgi:membrane protein